MTFLSTFNWLDLFYSMLTAIVTVVLVIGLRVFGNLPVGIFGPDLNLLTYGFLWDVGIKAMRNVEYWPRFDPTGWPLNKPTTLITISLINLILMGWNMKLADNVATRNRNGEKTWYTEGILKPFIIAIGITSLIVFLYVNSVWG